MTSPKFKTLLSYTVLYLNPNKNEVNKIGINKEKRLEKREKKGKQIKTR
jgi:hypothetical protein